MVQYKEFLLKDIVSLEYGNKFDKNKMVHRNPSVNFVSRTGSNNGISDFVDELPDMPPYPGGTVTLAFGGSIGSCFLQEYPYYTGQNVGVIRFAENVSDNAKLFFTCALSKICKAKYVAFGDEINKHFKTDLSLLLPAVTVVMPDWDAISALMTSWGGGADMSKIDTSSWKKFKISDLFGKAKLGKYHRPETLTADPKGYEYICASNLNNGVNKDLPRVSGANLQLTAPNIIAWGKQCPMFTWHKDECVTSQGMYYIELGELSEQCALFIITLLEHACKGRYGYNNCLIGSKFDEIEISLPVTEKEVPDWDCMAAYIRVMEKLVIRDVVDFKDSFIQNAKLAVARKNAV